MLGDFRSKWLPRVLTGLIALCLLLAGCQNLGGTGHMADRSGGGIGGTGRQEPDEGGIGGTGRVADNGIGGTGMIADSGLGGTGIIGTITRFGSIWVNNAHILFESDTPVRLNHLPGQTQSLRVGQVVAVLGDRQDEHYQARSIDVVYEVVGPISALLVHDEFIRVLSQIVRLSPRTRLYYEPADQVLSLDQFWGMAPRDTWVKVSGLRRANGDIEASRIDLIEPPAQAQVQVSGRLTRNDQGDWEIHGQPLSIADWMSPEALKGRVLVNGVVKNGVIEVDQLGPDSTQHIIDMASDVLIEGFVYTDDIDDLVMIGDLEIDLPEHINDDLFDQHELDDLPVHVWGNALEDGIMIDDLLLYSEDGEYLMDLIPDELLEDDWEHEYEHEEPEFDEVELPDWEHDEMFDEPEL